jgi:hypothetical protein
MRKELFCSLFFFLFAIYLTIESFSFGLGEWSTPGPGFYPFGTALLMGIVSLKGIVKALRTAPSKGKEITTAFPAKERIHWKILVWVMVGMIAYCLLLKWIGFVICTFLLVVFFMRVLARERLFTSFVTALSAAVGCELLFNVFLNAQIPNGILTFLRR